MPISGHGWELHVTRLGVQRSGTRRRTYGAYQVYIDGRAVAGLSGYMCECIGPGDKVAESGKRILQGRYPLWTQFGRYRTIGYSTDTRAAGKHPMPGLRLGETSPRTGILIHPGHPPKLYLSSIGCLNPTNPRAPAEVMDFWDSRSRTIALIDSLRGFDAPAFRSTTSSRIADAWTVIDGEPMEALPAGAPHELGGNGDCGTGISAPLESSRRRRRIDKLRSGLETAAESRAREIIDTALTTVDPAWHAGRRRP